MSLAGTYLITSAFGNNVYLTPSPDYTTSLYTTVLAGTPSFGAPDQWNFVPAGSSGSNLYTITRGVNNTDFLFVGRENKELWITADASLVNATEFSIESAGNGLVRFHVPGQDDVLTVDEAGGLVNSFPDEGLTGQRWITQNINGLD